MDFATASSTIVTFIVLAMLIVCWGGVVPREYQTWPVILGAAVGIPVFLLVMATLFGLILG